MMKLKEVHDKIRRSISSRSHMARKAVDTLLLGALLRPGIPPSASCHTFQQDSWQTSCIHGAPPGFHYDKAASGGDGHEFLRGVQGRVRV